MKTFRIAILAYPGCMAAQVFAISDVLGIAADIDAGLGQTRRLRFELQVIAMAGRSEVWRCRRGARKAASTC
jgi:hypothetical protein